MVVQQFCKGCEQHRCDVATRYLLRIACIIACQNSMVGVAAFDCPCTVACTPSHVDDVVLQLMVYVHVHVHVYVDRAWWSVDYQRWHCEDLWRDDQNWWYSVEGLEVPRAINRTDPSRCWCFRAAAAFNAFIE